MNIQNIVKKITPTLKDQGVIKVALFGSVVR
jgi:predicted nucleotidyltransferase